MSLTHQPSIKVTTQGNEGQPLLIIDDCVADPQALIDAAQRLDFQPLGPYYPGKRAPVPMEEVTAFLEPLKGLIAEVFGGSGFKFVESLYSLVTTPPALLQPIQRLPHFDGLDSERIALLHYLGRDQPGGTAFYRHRSTGFETVTAERYQEFAHTLKADVTRCGLPPASYISGDTPIYEQISHVEAKFNRAILYRGITLHCANIPAGMDLPADIHSGRLTVNTFLLV